VAPGERRLFVGCGVGRERACGFFIAGGGGGGGGGGHSFRGTTKQLLHSSGQQVYKIP